MYRIAPDEPVFTDKEWRRCLTLTIMAVCYAPLLYLVPVLATLAIAPFLCWIIFKPRVETLPALFIIIGLSSTPSLFVGFSCLLYCICNIDRLSRMSELMLLILYLTIFPFFIWFSYQRIKYGSNAVGSFGSIGSSLGTYFSVIPFFWSILAFKEIPKIIFRMFFWICILSFPFPFVHVFIQSLPIVGLSYFAWGMAFIGAYMTWNILSRVRVPLIDSIAGFSCIGVYLLSFCLGIGGRHASFSPLVNAVLASIIVIVVSKFRSFLFVFFPIVVLTITSWHVWNSEERVATERGKWGSHEYYEDDMKVTGISSLYQRLKRKSIDDRATGWMLAVKGIKNQFARDPVFVPPYREMQSEKIYDQRIGGERFVETNLPAHNVFLQLLQDYGLWGGGGMFIVYVLIFSQRKTFWGVVRLKNTYYLPVMATAIAMVDFASYSSANTVTPSLGFILYTTLGICARQVMERQNFYPNRGY